MLSAVRPTEEAAQTLRIGQLAALAQVGVETLRFYEREGLLERPYQQPSGYRAYPAARVEVVQTIKRAQALGFKLAEIRELLKGARTGQVSERANQKLQEIDATIAQLAVVREELARLVEYRCDRLIGCSCGHTDCPVHSTVQGPMTATELNYPNSSPPNVPRTGLMAAGVAAAACSICCAPFAGAILAWAGLPAVTAGEGAEIGLGAAPLAATGLSLVQLRKWLGRRSPERAV